MRGFKHGDRVMVNWPESNVKETKGTVISHDNDCGCTVRPDVWTLSPSWGVQPGKAFYCPNYCLEPLDESGELQADVDLANAGIKALARLKGKASRLKWSNYGPDSAVNFLYDSTFMGQYFGLFGEFFVGPDEPAFEPFEVGQGWLCRLEEGHVAKLKVGCLEFEAPILLAALDKLLERGGEHSVGGGGTLSAFKGGVSLQPANRAVSWEDAERIRDALRKAMGK